MNSQLTKTRNLLQELLKPDLPKNNWIRLFGRQLERLLNQHYWLPEDSWIKLHDDLLYTLEKLNGEQNKNDSWICFLEKMKFDSELEQRQLQFDQMIGKRKVLWELIDENSEFLEVLGWQQSFCVFFSIL
jgi:hypothetical protein